MGLASALSTALTGLTGAETMIDVIGNNLANSQTVGFKASNAVFATQYLQTGSIGAAPTANSGGVNPRQTGLGSLVVDIRPDFTPGTIGPSASPTDMAIQGEGFFQVQAATGETLYTRNGIFTTNAQNQLVDASGNRVLGFGVDDKFQIQESVLVPLSIPLGASAVAAPTENVYLEGVLTPTGDLADTAAVVESGVLGDASAPRADSSGTTISVAAKDPAAPDDSITGNYSYMVTYYKNGEAESRPSVVLGPVHVTDGRVQLTDLPTPPAPGADGEFPAYDEVRIYRNLSDDPNSFYLVDTVSPGSNYVDSRSDAEISDLATAGNQPLDLDGPTINPGTRLVDVVRRDGLTYEPQFTTGVLEFTGDKGSRGLTTRQLEITEQTTVQDLVEFMEDALGIQSTLDDPSHPIPNSINNIPGESGTLPPGVSIVDGQIRVVSNNGVDNAVSLNLSSFRMTAVGGAVANPNLGFGNVQEAAGQSAVTDFVAYDSLGVPLNVRVTSVLESRTGSTTTYRWFADAGGNDPLHGADLSVGTGLVSFDSEGNFLSATNTTVAVARQNTPSTSPLEFNLDFSKVSGLSAGSASLAATRQDGSPAGSLSSYTIGEDGVIRGVFTNGVTRDLGQVELARFSNPSGLVQRGLNLYAQGVNSGLPIQGEPGENGVGSLVSGAVELSNTDVGRNLIDLVLASTQYRGNSRVITTVQQMMDELLNLSR
ncbi:flagellar hook-basal body complex protein [Lignipirellula cremea]|uniref:Flagellar hook protein FlgE n=1 Tax=Lignipirellula cremea TaxID=2528010 RepID=A0A518DSJ7_9BACT|nr:flagellar hook-basal body complex protein [Lignipirellula cremea]QDU94813.1 Flagellar hook protein FlgE [Lignipirellula cremea]